MSISTTERTSDGLQALCGEVYRETEQFYKSKAHQMGATALGFAILYGPPILNPETLFLGFQPGGGLVDAEAGLKDGERNHWPDRIHYATEEWRLATQMRQIWHTSTLDRCTGLNATFFRAPNIKEWNTLPGGLRQEMEEFSNKRARRLIDAMAPKRIVVIGLGTFDLLADRGHELVHQEGQKTLIKQGRIWGVPAIGIIHLSGARIRREEMDVLAKYFAPDNVKSPAS